MSFTRRTHIVRVSDAGKDEKPEDGNYIDVEVLDAICFHIENGKEVVLSMKNGKAFIEDQTDGKHGKGTSNASRRSVIKRVKGDNGAELDVETLECAAFTDQNGGEWILNMKDPGNVFDTTADSTDTGGSGQPSRRGHSEKITDPFDAKKGGKKPTSYLTMQRHDMLAFRREGGKEVILKAPSSDDPSKPENVRANTFLVTPSSYDPTDPDQKVPKNEDENVYFAFVKDKSDPNGKSKNFLTGDKKIVTGPLWWIRKVSTIGGFLEIDWIVSGTSSELIYNPTIEGFAAPISDSIVLTDTQIDFPIVSDPPPVPPVKQNVTDAMIAFYNCWTNQSPKKTANDFGDALPTTYLVWRNDLPYPPEPPGLVSGLVADFGTDSADAYAYAALVNADVPGRIIGYVHANTGPPDFTDVEIPIISGGSPPVHVIPVSAEPAGSSFTFRGSQIFNLKNSKPLEPKRQNEYELVIKLPATSTVAFQLCFRTYKTKHRDFHTETATGKVAWDKGDEVDKFVFAGFGGPDGAYPATTLTLKIDAAKLTITADKDTSQLEPT